MCRFCQSALRGRPKAAPAPPGWGRFLAGKTAEVIDRLAQPLHRELDVLRLQLAPALDFGLITVLREALEIFRGKPPGGRAVLGEFLVDEGVWHRPQPQR